MPYTLDSLIRRMGAYKQCDDNEKRYLRELGLTWRGKPTHLGSIIKTAQDSGLVSRECVALLAAVSNKNPSLTMRWVHRECHERSTRLWGALPKKERILWTLAYIECRYGINPTSGLGYVVRASDLPYYTSQMFYINHSHTQHDQLSPLVTAHGVLERIIEEESEIFSLYIINTTVNDGEIEDERMFITDFRSEQRLRRYLSTVVREDDLYLYEITEWDADKERCFDSYSAEEF